MPYFEQEIFEKAQAKGPLTEKAYVDALAKNLRLTRAEGIDKTMDDAQARLSRGADSGPATLLDLVNGDYGPNGSSSMPAVAGYPDITVPAGYAFGLPVGHLVLRPRRQRAHAVPDRLRVRAGHAGAPAPAVPARRRT